jgi:hypothetical protein
VYVLTTDNAGPEGETGRFFRIVPAGTTSTEELPAAARIRLEPGFPNPFTATTTLRYTLPTRARALVTVTDVLGRTIRHFLEGALPAGTHEIRFDAAGLPGGVYFVRLNVEGIGTDVQRVVLVR